MPEQIDLETLQAQVLALSRADRSCLLERLAASLDVEMATEEEWEGLAGEREAEYWSGQGVAFPIEDAMAHLRARFPGRRLRSTPEPGVMSQRRSSKNRMDGPYCPPTR